MHSFAKELQQVLRRLTHAPLFAVITLITLAAGVGGNTVVFSVLESVLLKPLPYPHPEQLIAVWHTAPGINLPDLNTSPSNYFIYREQNQTLQDIGSYDQDAVTLTGVAEPQRLQGLRVTDGVLPILGTPPLLGRTFTRQDDSPGSPDTVVITYGFWKKQFGGSPNVLGQNITLDGDSYQIIGVMPQRFHFLDFADPAVILPFKFDRSKVTLGNFSQQGLARLKPGVTLQQASADIARMLPSVERSFPPPPGFSAKLFDDAHIAPNLRTLKNHVIGDVGSTLWVLMGSLGLVLLIACANVANLLLVRVEGRRQELAVRSALGASPYRIATDLLLESLILGILGSALGLGLAYAALRILVAIAPAGIPRINEIGIDGPALLFTFCLAIFVSLLFGSIPIFKYAGLHLSTGIREGGRANSSSREQHRVRNVLVVVQVALALVLLICSGLMIRTFRALTHVNPGFSDPVTLQTFRIGIPGVPDDQPNQQEAAVRSLQAMQQKIAAIPGVASVAVSTQVPMDGNDNNDIVFAEDHPSSEGHMPPLRRFAFVAPGLFSTQGTPLIAGRDFTWDDVYKRLPVAVFCEGFARDFWGSPEAALGKRIRVANTDDWREIVGVAANVYSDGVNQRPSSMVYWPLLRDRFEGQQHQVATYVAFQIRTPRAGAESLMSEVRQAVWSINQNLPLSSVHTLDYYYTRSMARTSFTLIMLAVAGSMALLLGIVGIYGVIAYAVSQRTREIGIRMALGARSGVVTNMFVRQGVILTAIGVACGLVASFITMRLMASILFHVKPIDPLTYSAVTLGLLATAFIASYLPARRAANVDPVDALRAE
jgi:predicted permease